MNHPGRKRNQRPTESSSPSSSARPADWLEQAAEMAGFFAAHAVWCVSPGDMLVPLAGYQSGSGDQGMLRFACDDNQEAVARGRDWLTTNPQSVLRAVLIFDAFIGLESGKTDALIVQAVDYTQPDAAITWAIPYRSAKDAAGFAVYGARIMEFDEPDERQAARLNDAFARGSAKHEKGSAVWERYFDDSR